MGRQLKIQLPSFSFEKIVKAERKKVFDIVTNFEEFQNLLPQYFESIRIRSSRDNVTVLEEHVKIAGREIVMMTKHIVNYPDTHEVFVIGGDSKGSHILERYETIPEGTKIFVEADIKLKGAMKIAGLFGKGKIIKGFTTIMDEFTKIAES